MPGYRVPARLLHWIVAVLVFAMLPVGQIMVQDGLPRPAQDALFIFHKNVGVVVLLLVLCRLAYRAMHPAPPLPDHVPGWQRVLAALNHWGLYLLLLVMTLSGYVRVRAGDFPIEWLDALGVPPLVPSSEPLAETAQAIHFYARYVLAALIAVHVAAALQHALIRRDGVFRRMWPPHRDGTR